MSSITGRIALVAYIVGAMLIPWTHHHADSACSKHPVEPSAISCGCLSAAPEYQSTLLDSTTAPQTFSPAVSQEVNSSGNDSESCSDACKVCALLESGHPDAIPPCGHQFELVTSHILTHVGIELPNPEPLFLTAPRGPPTA